MNRKSKAKDVPDLVKLRPWCGEFVPYEIPADGFYRVRLGHRVKVYGRKGRWVYQGPGLKPDEEFLPPKEMAALKDKRSLEQLQEEALNTLEQLIVRCHCGDEQEQAITKYVLTVRNAVGSLENLIEAEPAKLKAEAEAYSDWPVMFSLNPKDVERAKKSLASMDVGGAKALIPTQAHGPNLDRRRFWTRLAERALKNCNLHREIVWCLEAHAKGSKMDSMSTKFWSKPVEGKCHTLQNGEQVALADWRTECGRLPVPPVSRDSFPKWWKVVELCVLEYWQTFPDEYANAIKRIPARQKNTASKTDEYYRLPKEHRKRALALASVKQAFESLVGVK